MAQKELSTDEFVNAYTQTSENVSKLFLFVFVLIFAVGVFLINIGQTRLFYVHLITATHFVSFTIIIMLVVFPLIIHGLTLAFLHLTSGQTMQMNPNAPYFTIPAVTILLAYAYAMQQRLYGKAILINSLKAVLLVVAFIAAVLLYRFFLFVVTVWLV